MASIFFRSNNTAWNNLDLCSTIDTYRKHTQLWTIPLKCSVYMVFICSVLILRWNSLRRRMVKRKKPRNRKNLKSVHVYQIQHFSGNKIHFYVFFKILRLQMMIMWENRFFNWNFSSQQRNWAFVINSDFLILLYLKPNVVDL